MYRLTGRLEQGELADLYQAERDGRPVVVKLFHQKTSDAAYARAVAETARRLQRVTRAGVARVLDVGLVERRLAVVREDVGRTTLGLALRRLDTREVILAPVLALTMVLELLELLGEVHDAGVVHGALTPGNVLLDEHGRVGVADFGSLQALEASPGLRKAFASRGRSSYRAPEGGGGSEAGDIYALGAITYELLTLREASLGRSAVSTRGERLPPPSRLARRLNSRIDPVVMRALEASPPRRYRSCVDFADAVRDFLSAQGGLGGREELAAFVKALFPNEVQLAAPGPVPFEAPFTLEDIAGVPALEGIVDDVAERASFSGGAVDGTTPTSDGLPVFLPDDAESTVTDGRPPPTETAPMPAPEVAAWVAPEVAEAAPASSGDVARRMRAVEDFAPVGQPRAAPTPRRKKKQQSVAKTIMTFVVPFKRHGDPEPPDLEAMRLRSRKQARVVAFIATIVLTSAVLGLAVGWYQSTPQPWATFVSYLPPPIARALAPDAPPPPRRAPGKPLKLPDFDEKRAPPEPDEVRQPVVAPPKPPAPRDEAPTKPGRKAADDCYRAPKGAAAHLALGNAKDLRVEIDGKRVCDAGAKVAVQPGPRKVRIIDVKTKRDYTSTVQFKAGKSVNLVSIIK